MLIEEILLLIIGGGAVFFLGIPAYKIVKALLPSKTNALADAKERLEKARLDAEAARLDKETNKIYNDLYQDVLDEDEDETTHEHRRV